VAPHQLQGKSPAESVRWICEEEPRKASGLNRELGRDEDNMLQMAMRKEARQRYRSVEQFAADIGRYLSNEPVLARPARAGYHLRKYVRGHRIGAAVAAGLVLLLASFVAVQAAQLRRITRERDRADRVTQFMNDLALNLNREGHHGEAEKVLRDTLDVRRRHFGPQQPDTLRTMSSLAITITVQSRYAEAERLQSETLDMQRRVLGPEHPETLRSMTNLANVLSREGRYPDAEKLEREALGMQHRVLGPEHPETLRLLTNLANTLSHEGRYAEAEKLQRETLGIQRRVLGPEHPGTLVTMTDLGVSLKQQSRYAEAEKLQREALGIQRRVLGPEHPSTLRSINILSS